jgi:opacity protein-like surface antigen
MRQLSVVMLVICFCASLISAQTTTADRYPKVEVFAGYSANGYFVNNDLPTVINSLNFSPFFTDAAGGSKGFETSITGNVNRYLGIKGDFSMHFNNTKSQGEFRICQDSSCAMSAQDFNLDRRAFYLMGGPEIKARNRTRLTPFAHALFGVARSRAEFSTTGSVLTHSDSSTDTGFAMAFGGGLDARINKRFSIRGMVDYTATFLKEGDTGSRSRQNHVRLSLGILFH